jgi:hypothetical protein
MTTIRIEDEILSREKSYWDALKTKNGATIEQLTGDTCLVVGGEGIRQFSGSEVAAMMDSVPFQLQDYGIESGDVKFVNARDDVAILAYKVRADYVVDGKDQRIDAYDTSVWVRRDGAWTCALHTETPAAIKPPDGKVA